MHSMASHGSKHFWYYGIPQEVLPPSVLLPSLALHLVPATPETSHGQPEPSCLSCSLWPCALVHLSSIPYMYLGSLTHASSLLSAYLPLNPSHGETCSCLLWSLTGLASLISLHNFILQICMHICLPPPLHAIFIDNRLMNKWIINKMSKTFKNPTSYTYVLGTLILMLITMNAVFPISQVGGYLSDSTHVGQWKWGRSNLALKTPCSELCAEFVILTTR